MTFSLDNLGRSEGALLFSASLNLMTRTIDLRNGSSEMNVIESIGRKIVGELCFAAVVVASLVETVFRLVLALPGSLILCINPERLTNDHKLVIVSATFIGAVISMVNIAVAVVALFRNIFPRPFGYNEILPCVTRYTTRISPLVDIGERYMRGRVSFFRLMVAAYRLSH